MLNRIIFFFCTFFVVVAAINASDLARESRMADEIVDSILDGEAVFLTADENKFLTIYTEAETDTAAKGVVIILHGRGFHPDWQDTVNPLRVGLAESGWNTLSVQMPVLEKQAKYYDYLPLFPQAIPRIEAAIAYAREQITANKLNNKVVLLAHSCGAHMAMTWVNTESYESMDAYVGIGMGATDYKQPMKQAFPLQKVKVPVLDVYAENDYPAVKKMAAERWRDIQLAANKKSRQILIPDADHYYTDRGEILTDKISRWLDTL